MDFSLTEDQIMIRDAAQSYLKDNCGSEAVRAAMATDMGYDSAVWQAISAELGWSCVAIPEEHGGMGLGAVELMLIQEQAGYHLLPSPFFPTVCLAATVLETVATAEAKAEFLPGIAAGETTASLMMCAADDWQQTTVSAEENDNQWRLTGTARMVDAGPEAIQLVFATTPNGIGLFVLEPADQAAVLSGWDQSRRFRQQELQAAVARRIDDADNSTGRNKAASLIRLLIAAEQLGAAQLCLDLTVEYVAERKQFGRAVGSFQAIKHRCAEMMIQVEALRSAVYGAAALAASGDDLAALQMECDSVKAQGSEALFYCAGEAIQCHGGVGFTAEYDPQLFFKRAQASRHWMGTPEALRARIAEGLL